MMCLALAVIAPRTAYAEIARPLLVEGKKTLYQKVITRPGATIAPTLEAATAGEPLPPFSVLYVYNRSDGRIQVGHKTDGTILGWMDAAAAMPWAQTIVVAFGNPAGRSRVLMFKSKEDIEKAMTSPGAPERIRALADAAEAGDMGPDKPVVAIEPETYVDIQEHFYFFPILNHERRVLSNRVSGTVLEVASLSDMTAAVAAVSREDALQDFNAGIVFVVDTTRSMAPYIKELRESIEQLQAKVGGSELGEKVRFGLIGFRQNPKLTPSIEYQTKVFLKLDRNATAESFVQAIQSMETAPVSTDGFREDALGGMHEALQSSEWDAFGARMIILVTDAGPRVFDPNVPDATLAGRLGPAELNHLAREKGIETFVMHLKTEEGIADHQTAQNDYEALSKSAAGGSNYMAIPGGDPAAYRAQVDHIADVITSAINTAAAGMTQEALPADAGRVERAILAMQLRYLGAAEGQAPPDVFRAWIADKDLLDPTRAAVDVRVLLNKNQLATLREVAQAIVTEGGDNIPDPAKFFEQLRSAMALMARNPDRVVDAQASTLGDALGEYLVDLPYRSEILSISEDDWKAMGGGKQRQLLDGLQRKLAFYDEWHNTPANWTAPYEGAPDGEYVTALPLDAMP